MNKLNKLMLGAAIIFAIYCVYCLAREAAGGKPDLVELAIIQCGFQVLGFYFWYYLVPMFIYKKIRKFFASPAPTAFVAVPQQLDLAEDMTG